MVDRGFMASEVEAHPKLKDLKPLAGSTGEKFTQNCVRTKADTVVCFRAMNFRHSCNPNAEQIHSSNLRVTVTFAERDIKAGEEIFVAFYNFRWIYRNQSPEEIRYIMLDRFGVVCPIDCACRDPVKIGQVQKAKMMKRTFVQMARQGKFREAFQGAKCLVKYLEDNNMGQLQICQTQ